MTEFRKKHPLVQFRIYSGNADNIQDYIGRGHLDMWVIGGPGVSGKCAFVTVPVKECWGILVLTDSGLAQKE